VRSVISLSIDSGVQAELQRIAVINGTNISRTYEAAILAGLKARDEAVAGDQDSSHADVQRVPTRPVIQPDP
jgi:hypothetical protein